MTLRTTVHGSQTLAYERYERSGRENGHALELDQRRIRTKCLFLASIFEQPEQLDVNIELRGCLCHEIEACLEPRRRLLRTQKTEEDNQTSGEVSHREQHVNGIYLALNLPDHVDSAKVTALLKDDNFCLTLSRGSPATHHANQANVCRGKQE